LIKSRFIVWPSPQGGGFFCDKEGAREKEKRKTKKKTPLLRYNIFIYIQNKLTNIGVDK
jgi:hypothetical protein